jgi:histidinol-phosphate phosphatase family protein
MTRVPPPIVFLDRDGTIIEDPGYLRDPDRVVLLPGAAEAIARLNAAGIPVAVVTNQSGIARGFMSEEDYQAVAQRLDDLLAAAGARLDTTAYCPHAPEISGPCDCRKPETGLHRGVAMDLDRTVRGSWCVGDRLSDVECATNLGGFGILLADSETGEVATAARRAGFGVASDLAAAVDRILQ